jgi:ubiquinone/menaquinone biosynthesis C-methylase UbiE
MQDECDISFFPPLWQQRRYFVASLLEKYNVKNVLDLGCGEGKLIKFVKNSRHLQEIIGIDIDLPSLEIAKEVPIWFYR